MRRSVLAMSGVGALTVLLGVAVVLRGTGVACAMPLPAAAAAATSGRATYYGNAGPGGACSFPAPPANHLTTAAGPALYAAAAACGGYLEVTGRRGTIQVKVDNLCPECEPGHLDLSTEAFARLDALGVGITPITYHQVVDPALSSGLSFRVKEGSSQWWLAILVDQHGNPLRSVEISSDGRSWKALSRTDYNYWLAASGAGPGPFSVRVTDVRGHVAVAKGIAIKPGTVQQTSARLYGSGSSGATAAAGTAGTAKARAKGTASTARPTAATARALAATASAPSHGATPPPASPADGGSGPSATAATTPPDGGGRVADIALTSGSAGGGGPFWCG